MTTIFEHPWWIDAATGGAFRHVRFADGESVSAEMIVVPRRERRMNGFAMPLLARVTSPRIAFGSNAPKNPLSLQVKAVQGLRAQLPACDHLSYTLPPGSDLVLAHDLAGYDVTPAFTFRSRPGGDALSAMDQKIRYNIRAGQKRIRVRSGSDVERFIALSRQFVRGRAFRNYYDYAAIRRIFAASAERGQSAILSALDPGGREVASVILLWDHEALYYWLNCRDPDSKDYTANSVLIWEAMRLASERGLVFDIDGYATPNAGLFLSRFGLVPVPRHEVRYESPRFALREAGYVYLADAVGARMRSRLLEARNRLTGVRLFRPDGKPARGTAD